MAAEPHHSGQVLAPEPFVIQPSTPSGARTEPLQSYAVDLPNGPLRRLVFCSVVSGHVTCMVHGAGVVGSAGVPLCTEAVATARTADEARQQALSQGLARYAAGFWNAAALSRNPPQAPHGMGPGPWVGMWVGEQGEREVWMPAERVYMPFLQNGGHLAGDDEGLACAGSVVAARSGALVQQVGLRAMRPLWQTWERESRLAPVGSFGTPHGCRDLIVAHAHGLSLAMSYQWSTDGPFHGIVGLGCAADDEAALAQARLDRVHTEAQLRLQQAGVWGGQPKDRPPGMALHVHRLAWHLDHAMALAALVNRWRARARSASGAQRSALAWIDLTPPALREMGLSVVRALWLDGERGGFSPRVPTSQPH